MSAATRAATATAPSPTTPEDLGALVEEIWSSLLGADEPLLPVLDDSEDGAAPDAWAAQVDIAGDWHGTVRVELAPPLAVALTTHMVDGGTGDPVTVADLEDAVGELANVVGGNVKSLLPGEGHLSLPRVGQRLPALPGVPVCRSDHNWAGHRLTVLLGAAVPSPAHDQSREPR